MGVNAMDYLKHMSGISSAFAVALLALLMIVMRYAGQTHCYCDRVKCTSIGAITSTGSPFTGSASIPIDGLRPARRGQHWVAAHDLQVNDLTRA